MKRLAYRYYNMKAGEYRHPTIEIYVKDELEEYSLARSTLTFTSQTDQRNTHPYGMTVEMPVEWNYNIETAITILKEINKLNMFTFRGVVKYLKTKKAVRYHWIEINGAGFQAVPYRVRKHAELYWQAKKAGLNITKKTA